MPMKDSNAQRWHRLNWRKLQGDVWIKQQKIVKAMRNRNKQEMFRLQEELIQSFAGRAVAVLNVSRGRGSKTPGMDKFILGSPSDKWKAIGLVCECVKNVESYKTGGTRRVWIPKGTNEKRPLGIPSCLDRCVQALVVLALDPIIEATADIHSYGFRKGRSGAHAMARIRHILDKDQGPRFVLEADIAKCFDHISHEFILKKSAQVMCQSGQQLIRKFLTDRVYEAGVRSYIPREGTPQGGVISPILSNMALDGLEGAVRGSRIANRPQRLTGPSNGLKSEQFALLKGIWVVRYADDFIITCPDRDRLEGEILKRVKGFLKLRGLTLNAKKTVITDVRSKKGFSFLGWSVRLVRRDSRRNSQARNAYVLLMSPSPNNLKKIKRAVTNEFNSGRRPITSIVRTLNPILRGWTNYFRTSYHSQEQFQSLQHHVYSSWKRWSRKRHPKQKMQWIVDKYIQRSGKRKWIIGTPKGVTVMDPSTAIEWKVRPLKNGVNWYEDAEYFSSVSKQVDAEKFRKKVYDLHSNKCAACMQWLNDEDIELHHIIPKKDGGAWSLKNIVPLHKTCHTGITQAKTPIYPHLDGRLKVLD
jgi:RNA-directed DNA polymerase